MRAVRNPAGMQGDRAGLDASAGTKVAANIKEDLIGLDVVMHPRDLHCLWMGIE